jgi:hypothetical protein
MLTNVKTVYTAYVRHFKELWKMQIEGLFVKESSVSYRDNRGMKAISKQAKMNLVLLFSAGLLIFSYQNCNLAPVHEGEFVIGSSLPELPEGEVIEVDPVLEEKALQILQNRCVSCHNNSFAEFGINLEGDSLSLVGRGLIVPGLPEASSLYKSVISQSRVADGITPMPIGNPLSSAEKSDLEQWIAQGVQRKQVGGDPQARPEAYYYDSDIKPILEAHDCLQCHSGSSGNGGYIQLDSYAKLMGFVTIGSEDSLLYDSIVSGRMPKNRAPIPEEKQKIIRAWILNGAPESAQ